MKLKFKKKTLKNTCTSCFFQSVKYIKMQIITGYREKNAGTLITETVSHINSGCTMNQKNSVMICGFGVSGKAAGRKGHSGFA